MDPSPPQPTTSGRILQGRAPTHITIVLGVLLVLTPVTVLLAAGGLIEVALVLGLGLAVGLALVVPRMAVALRWHPPELEVATWPLLLGSSAEVIYRRRPRRTADLPPAAIAVTLSCIERVRYRVGTDTRTDTAEVVRRAEQIPGAGTPRGFEATFRLDIPLDAGAPTLQLTNNKISWELTTSGSGAMPADTHRFTIIVVAAVDWGSTDRPVHDRRAL